MVAVTLPGIAAEEVEELVDGVVVLGGICRVELLVRRESPSKIVGVHSKIGALKLDSS